MAIVTKTLSAGNSVKVAIKGSREYAFMDASGALNNNTPAAPITPAPDTIGTYGQFNYDTEWDLDNQVELVDANGLKFWGVREKRKK